MEADFPTVLGILDGLRDRVGLLSARREQPGSIPVRIDPRAAERIAELGVQPAVEAMLAYSQRILHRLIALEVIYHGGPDELGHFPYPLGILGRVGPDSEQVLSSAQCRWYAWRDWRFPRRIRRLFGVSIFYCGPGYLQPKWLTDRE